MPRFGSAGVVLMDLLPCINATILGRDAGGIIDNEGDEHGGTPRAGSLLLWKTG